jgi:cyclic beta-1,2-glucan synthetase
MTNKPIDQNSSANRARVGDEATNNSQFEDLARQHARARVVARHPAHELSFVDQLREREWLVRDATARFRDASPKEPLSYAAEWMLDNFYLVQQSLRQIREDMPPGFYRQLPKLAAGPLEGYPRIYAIAQELVEGSGAHLDLDHVKRFVHPYQDITPLSMGELWALPAMLRLGVLECLAQALGRITGLQRENSLPAMTFPHARTDDEVVANCIVSLRTLAIQDWQLFFESVSRVEQVLRDDPARVYVGMDRETRDRYRKVIEELAQATGRDEQQVAREAIELAQRHVGKHVALKDSLEAPRATHVGYYLLDVGRALLEDQVGYRVPARERLRRWIFDHPTLVYLGSIGLFTLIILLGGMGYARDAGATFLQWTATGLLFLIPALTVSVSLVNWMVTLAFPPRVLPKMDFEDGIPAERKTMVVVPSLLTSTAEVESLLQQLELHFLRNQDPHLSFALLTDLPDTPQPRRSGDDTLVEQAASGIRALNEKYHRKTPSPFYLFHRDPKWNPREQQWMGWERKRGKLHQLNLLLRGGGETAFSVQTGDLAVLREIKYVITLDTDTIMPREAAHRLVATLAHPLNRAEFDLRSGAVIAGYTVLQPGIEITSTSVNLSRFTRIFAGDVGLDLYTRAVSNAYQDLFGEGVYVGKGIYDIDAFERSLAGRMPENALLSHDLIEGIHGRVALVTDIVLFEEYPPHYFVYLRRSRRWIRGDWQLLPWLFPRVPSVGKGMIPNDLSAIARWKILDNLRRSLLSLALLILFIAGWLWLPGSPWAWTLAGLLTLAVPVFTGLVIGLVQRVRGKSWHNTLHPLQNSVVRWVLALAFILYETFVTLVGITRTLFRLLITRKHLLQWTSYADTVRGFAGGLTFRQMLAAMLSSVALALLIVWFNPAALFVALPLLVAWLLSPEIAYWISRPIRHAPAPLSPEERQWLRRLARRTWLFFEQFVGPEDHWLPPDHFQEAPRGIVAHSTSPTDLGLLLLSTLAAYDQGYIGLWGLSARLRDTFESMEHLEKYQGHFLNWYDTRSLEALPPRYVSTVDSGNLVACLRTLWQGCQILPHQPVLRWQNWEGLLDTQGLLDEIANDLRAAPLKSATTPLLAHLAQMRQQVLAVRDNPDAWAPLLNRLTGEGWNELNRLSASLIESFAQAIDAVMLRRLSLAADRVRNHLHGMQREMEQFSPWLLFVSQLPKLFARPDMTPAIRGAWQALRDAFLTAPSLEELGQVCKAGLTRLAELQSRLEGSRDLQGLRTPAVLDDEFQEARDWCMRLAEKLESAAMAANALLIDFQNLDRMAERYFQAMDFGFLFDQQRQLFHIGYNVTAEKLDSNYYDLLASEARISSLVSIAENQVPPGHWLHLGRPLTQVGGTRALLSWGGTMFEYLMPALMMRSYEGTFLHQSCLAAVDVQIAYGHEKNVPWGISESGYYAFDANQNYQYRSFGVPGLGFKRDLDEDLVVAPYASLLALSLRPRKVMENIARLDKLRVLGAYGLYESVDFSPTRLALGETHAVVRSYMAHHQGMILVSLVNYLHEDVMVRRFHADPQVRSVEPLLQEKVPYDAPPESPQPGDARGARRDLVPRQNIASPWSVPVQSPAPQVHFLSNGRYGVLITSAGAGYSCWQDIDLTRWRADTTREDWGTWVYLQDVESRDLWSTAYQPTAALSESQNAESTFSVQFYPYMAEFRRSDHGIGLTTEITVAPDDDVEIRRISLINHTDRVRHITLTSYGEIILAPQAADARHPAFNKMFVESEYLPETNALLFRRRPRSTSEEPIYLAHSAVVSPGHKITGAHETDRARFLGRGQTLRAPAALSSNGDGLSGMTGTTLDPIMALGQEIELQPHASAQMSFITLAASSREKALGLARRYQEERVIVRAFDQACVRAESELRQLDLTTIDLERIQQLLSALLYPCAALRGGPATLAANRKGQSGLWAFGISGDYPILLVRINSQEDLALVQDVLQAHAYWRNRHINIDLVILNQQGTTYGQELRGHLRRILARQNSEDWLNRRGGIFTLYADQLSEADQVLVDTAARAILDGAKGSLAQQLEPLRMRPTRLPPFTPVPPDSREEAPTPQLARPTNLLFDNGMGGFSSDGREYVIYLNPGQWTPAPWINVIANPDFGFTVSETGAGYTWFGNSSENRLTPWSNDPVTDPPGEALFLRDEETTQVWSPTPLPCRAPAPYLIRHGPGYSIFEHNSHGLLQKLRLFAAQDAPVKVVNLRLQNTWTHTRRITATFYAEWVLGLTRDTAQQYVVSEFDSDRQALFVRNAYRAEFGQRIAFVAANKRLHGLTADRTEFLGRLGSLCHPAALDRIGLASIVEPGLDPCAALQLHIDLKPGEAEEVCFLVGEGADREEALRLVKQHQDMEQVQLVWRRVNESWDNLLGAIQVQTSDLAMNLLMNRWLLYQTLSCRVWGRTAFYQSSGAFGFRDQLQDVMALVHVAPHLAREHVLQSAQHQFEAGDVLHWWHPPSGRGVRTRSSDDLLWLPFVTAHYVAATGDESILDERVPFRKAAPLETGEAERYDQYPITAEAYTLYEHCRRAIEKGTTAGAHGLPLMGSGDWNDGMNEVGSEGRGESVWLGWFLCATLNRFAELCDRRGDQLEAAACRQRAHNLTKALETNAWDGDWYRRAYYDDGTLLGSAANEDCQIDSIAQSWAVLSEAGDPARTVRAMEAVTRRLVLPDDQLLLLLTPPFDKTPRDPGYIKGYPPGIRENGGQYTHAALWAVWAFAKLGQGDRAESLFRMLNPIYHGDTPEKLARYQVEPYVVAADVYSALSYAGRGGWTWYTGSSGWMFRLGLEVILGIGRLGETLQINPCIPKSWQNYQVAYRVGETTFQIQVHNPSGINQGVKQVILDGKVLSGNRIPLLRDGSQHQVNVLMG